MNLKKILLPINILLTCLIIWVGATLVIAWPSKERAADTAENGNLKQKEKGINRLGETRSMNDYQALIQQDIFHTAPQVQAPEVKRAPVVEEKPVEVTRLNLKLKGVVIRSGDRSFAAIMDGATRKEDIYYVNDTVQNAKIAKILSDQVILEINNRQEALLLFAQTNENQKGAAVKEPERKPLRPARVEGPPPPNPERSSLGAGVASRLPAMIRQKRR